MAIFIGAALALLSIGVVLYPFLKPRVTFLHQAPPPNIDDDLPDLEDIYASIRTLQLEHQLGNVTEGLFREQLDGYRVQAAMVLRRQTETQSMGAEEPDADWALEQEIKVAGASLIGSGDQTISCPNCNAKLDAALTHCPECSVELGSSPRPTQGTFHPRQPGPRQSGRTVPSMVLTCPEHVEPLPRLDERRAGAVAARSLSILIGQPVPPTSHLFLPRPTCSQLSRC